MKVKIKRWNGVATWHWLTETDELCGICRVPFDGHCPSCRFPGDTCPLILGGGCPHNFHLHCIIAWLEQSSSKGLCPMCRQIFTATIVENVGSPEEIARLQNLERGHQITRELAENGELFEQPNEIQT